MAVMRVEKNSNYTVMANYHLRDKRLSLKAKGLLSVMISLPAEWDYNLPFLLAKFSTTWSVIGECSIKSSIEVKFSLSGIFISPSEKFL